MIHGARRQAAFWTALYAVSMLAQMLIHPDATWPIWYPPIAVAVGLLLACGLRWWPVVLLAEAIAAVGAIGHPAASVLGIGLPRALESLAVVALVTRFRWRFADADGALRVSALGVLAAAAGTTVGSLVLAAFGTAPDRLSAWPGWWAGDATALVVLLPMALLLTGVSAVDAVRRVGNWSRVEPFLLLAIQVVLVAGTAVFDTVNPAHRDELRLVWAVPVLWAAARRDRLTTSVIVVAMCATAFAAYTALPDPGDTSGSLGLQIALMAISLVGLSVSVGAANRRRQTAETELALSSLEETQHRNATLFERSPVIQLLIDPLTVTITDANAAAAAFYGYPLDALRGMPVTSVSLMPASDLVADTGAVGSQGVHLIDRSRMASGDIRTVEVQAGPVRIDGREMLHAVIRDVTDELGARQQIARLAAAVESSSDAVVTTDLDGVVTSWNAAAERLYGYSRPEALGRSVEQLVGHVAVPNPELLATLARDGVVRFGNVSRLNASGELVSVDLVVTGILDDDGILVGLSRIAHDLSDMIEAQERIRRSEALLADAARIGGIGSWEVDLATGGTAWSAELYRLVGKLADEPVTPESVMDLVHPDDRAMVETAHAAGTQASEPLSFRVQAADGRDRTMVATWRVEAGVDGGPGREIGVLRDVTDERLLEAQLRQAQRLESIGLLAGGIAHDFNNLLTAIAGFTELARLTAAEGGSPDSELMEIQAAVARAKSLTAQLLTFGRRAIVRPSPLHLSAAIEELVPMLRRLIGERIEITTSLDTDAVVLIDPGQLDQVLVSLVVNARDAMPNGGHLRISVGVDPAFAGTAWLTVEDDGSGVPADVLEQIFLPFFTTKEHGKGTGLGLSTVQGIVVAADGRIDVESQPGRGTTFRIVLPLANEPVANDPGLEPAPAHPGAGATVLLVEDEDLVRHSGARILERAGYHVVTAADAALALESSGRSRPDVLVTDIVLPGVQDGLALAETLHARWPNLPVLLVTGYTDHELPAWADFLPKPFTARQLVEHVGRLASGVTPRP